MFLRGHLPERGDEWKPRVPGLTHLFSLRARGLPVKSKPHPCRWNRVSRSGVQAEVGVPGGRGPAWPKLCTSPCLTCTPFLACQWVLAQVHTPLMPLILWTWRSRHLVLWPSPSAQPYLRSWVTFSLLLLSAL